MASSIFLKTVCLQEWWLIRAEKDFNGKRLAVGGLTSRETRATRVFSSAPIVKRFDLFSLETADGFTVLIKGSINKFRSQENGFSSEICSHFLLGFPYYWKTYADECLGKEPTIKGLRGSMCGFDESLGGNTMAKTLDRLISAPDVSEDTMATEKIHADVPKRCREHHIGIPAVPISAKLISSNPLLVKDSLTELTLGNDKDPKSEQKHKHDAKDLLPATKEEATEMSSDLEDLNRNACNETKREDQNIVSLQVKSENTSEDTSGQDKVKALHRYKRKSTPLCTSMAQEHETHKVVHTEKILRGGSNSISKRLDRSKIDKYSTRSCSMSFGPVNLIYGTYDSGKDDSTWEASTSMHSEVNTVCQSVVNMAASMDNSSNCMKIFPKSKVRVKKGTRGRRPKTRT